MGRGDEWGIILCCAVTAIALTMPSCSPDNETSKGFRQEREPRISEIRTKKPAKVKLKRLKNGSYTWEITGSDPGEVIETDSRLREKYYNKESSK